MNAGHRLAGYDRRVSPRRVSSLWPRERRERFLVRQDAPQPLSVDIQVWPQARREADEGLRFAGEAFGDLLGSPPESGGEPDDPCVIAVSVLWDAWSSTQEQTWNRLVLDRNHHPIGIETLSRQPDMERVAGEGWTLLGLDVADWGLVSSLTNCGLSPEEMAGSYRTRWAGRVNAHHLFDETPSAQEFVAVSNERVKEHAPFFVFGLWLVKD